MPKLSLGFTAFLQALGLFLYCSLVGLLMWRANSWFGPPPNFLGPTLFLLLFIVSAIICAGLFLGYPFILYWERKQTKSAIKLIASTTAWLTVFLLLVFFSLLFRQKGL